jgi:GR25 family glycosyltransferase involved in LPS biosynthesis
MKSFVISLPFRQDRLLKLNFDLITNHTIFEAIHYRSLTQEQKDNYIQQLCTNDNRIDSDGAMGCFISHYLVLCDIANQNENDYAYVFEDDVQITQDELFVKIETYIPKDFDILMLGGVFPNIGDTQNGFYIPNFNKSAACTEAYIVSKIGAQKIINYINNKTYTSDNIDLYLHYLGKIGALNYYCHQPFLTTQNHSDSNIKI